MSGLVLKLRPHEELMINGVVVENGDRNVRLRVKTAGANILRLRTALKSEDAETPIEQACYVAQLAVGGGIDGAGARDQIRQALQSATDENAAILRAKVESLLKADDFYQIMRLLSALIAPRAEAGEE